MNDPHLTLDQGRYLAEQLVGRTVERDEARRDLEKCRAENADLHAEIADLRARLAGDEPQQSGDVYVLGVGLISSTPDPQPVTVLNWRGVNFRPSAGLMEAAPAEERATFTIRPAGEPEDVSVALHSLGDCPICGNEVPAGAFAARIDDPEVHGWAHESCARPQNPTRPALNADQTRNRS